MAAVRIQPDSWKNWDRQGKNEFFNILKKTVSKDIEDNKSNVAEDVCQLIYTLISKGVKGELKKEQVTSVLGEAISCHIDILAIIVDIFNVFDAQTKGQEGRQNFCSIINDAQKVIPEKLLKERLEIETLEEVGILKNKSFNTKFIRVKTKLYYKQKKFNLFREESEGYAKLITELNQDSASSLTVDGLLKVTKSLIGCFNLDPNRVLDVILESFELRPQHAAVFTKLLKAYCDEPNVLCELLGFKFAHYHTNKERTPTSLYTVTALMLQYKIIDINNLYPWLMPSDSSIEKRWEQEMKEAKEYVRKLNIVSTKDKEKGEAEAEKESIKDIYYANQKFCLCEALLNIGAWSVCQDICRRLPDHSVMDQPPVAVAMCKLLHSLIDPVYTVYGGISTKLRRRAAKDLTNEFTPRRVSTLAAMRKDVIPMFVTLGPSLNFDPILMYKLIRLCKAVLQQLGGEGVKETPADSSATLYYDVVLLLDLVILPSLSYMDCNCSIAEEIWSVISNYPYQIRYCLYSRWKNVTPNDHAKLLRKNGETLKNIKNIMKRVSKENVKPVGRQIGRLTHASPGVLFDYVLYQIQMYENLIGPVVDSLKFLTSLSYDVLGYCLVETLANTSLDRDKFKYDGTSISMWLQSLSSFCGAAFKKYNIELTGLLQYVTNQLKAQRSLELIIVREVVQKMAGIEAAEEMTSDQLNAMSGGELLKGEAGYFSQVRNTKRSGSRLKDALAEQQLGVALCLLMAQQRYCIVYKETDKSHLKLVGKLYDQCQDTLVQFGTFLCSTLTVDEYDSRFPAIHAMLSDYHINADVAFFLARPTLNHAINLKFEVLRKQDSNYKRQPLASKQAKYCEAVREVMAPLVESVRPLHSAKVWEDISPELFVTFWSLAMYDLQVPVDSYQKEVNKIKGLALQAETTSSKGKKEQERWNALVEKLQDERKKQQEHVEKVLARLRQEKDTWFPVKALKSAKHEATMQFLQLCVFPRCIFTPGDAAFCSKFIQTIHQLKTQNFSTLLCIDRLFCDITYSVTLCTENEANRYGRFLCSMLELVMRWHSDENIFNKECAHFPGFVTKFRVSNQLGDANDEVSYENYRHVCHKWHYKITKSMMLCLESKDYTQIRNALIVLIKILPVYPVLSRLAVIIERRIDKVQQEEKAQRQDLYVLATSYAGHLKARASLMMRDGDFHITTDKKKELQTDADKKSSTAASNAATEKREKPEKNSKTEEKSEPKTRTSKKEAIDVKDNSPATNSKPDKTEKEKNKEEMRLLREEKQRAKERKEERLAKEERQYRQEERYVESMPLSKDEQRYSGGGSGGGGYYSGTGHYYEDSREISSLSNSSSGSHKHAVELPDTDRDVKRRKLEGTPTKMRKSEDWSETADKTEKKERGTRSKEKPTRDKDKERKERKLGRKRDRVLDESGLADGVKVRKEEEKMLKSSHQNGASEVLEQPSHREKRHYAREKSPMYERERSHDRIERLMRSDRTERSLERGMNERSSERLDRDSRDKHRRPETSKRR